MIVAFVALVAALSGSAIALSGKNKVKSDDIASGAVKTRALHNGAVKTQKLGHNAVKGNKLANKAVVEKKVADGAITNSKLHTGAVDATKLAVGSVTSSKIAAGAVGSGQIANGAVGNAQTSLVKVFKGGAVPVAATAASAPQVELGTVGPFHFYGKCFMDSGQVHAAEFIELTSGFATLDSKDGASFTDNGTGYLQPTTPEASRMLEDVATTAANSFNAASGDEEFQASASDGTEITGEAAGIGAKIGNPPVGNGPFLAGDSCIIGTIAIFGG